MNYNEIRQSLQDYLQTNETTFVNNIPSFVRQAEQRINREVIIPDLRKTITGAMTTGNRYLQKPTDYLATFALDYTDTSGGQNFLLLKDENFMREAYPNPTATGAPRYYGHFDEDFWVLGPTPDNTYTVKVRYYYDPESIVTAGTSWLGENADTALLYGAIVEAYTFLKGENDLLNQYEERYLTALRDLANLGKVMLRKDDYRAGERSQ